MRSLTYVKPGFLEWREAPEPTLRPIARHWSDRFADGMLVPLPTDRDPRALVSAGDNLALALQCLATTRLPLLRDCRSGDDAGALRAEVRRPLGRKRENSEDRRWVLRRRSVPPVDNGVSYERKEHVHAALVTLTIDPDQAPAAAKALTNDILPTVRSTPGFVAGYWLEPADGQGFSIVLSETEEQAREASPPVSSWAAPGVTIDGVEFRRVAATA